MADEAVENHQNSRPENSPKNVHKLIIPSNINESDFKLSNANDSNRKEFHEFSNSSRSPDPASRHGSDDNTAGNEQTFPPKHIITDVGNQANCDPNQNRDIFEDAKNHKQSGSDDNTGCFSPDHSYQERKELKRKILVILISVYVLAFLSSFSYWIQSGVLPYLTRKIGVTPVIFGYMQSSYAFYQMITSPLFGRLGDVLGVRFIFILSELGASVAYGSLALANSIPALFLTRVPALFMHGLQCAYMVITDVTLPDKRADIMGKLGVSHGLGMIFGAFVGGVVAEMFGEKAAAVIASFGNLTSIVIICTFIPAHTKPLRRQLDRIYSTDRTDTENVTTDDDRVTLGLTEIVKVLKYPNLKFLLLVKMLIALPYSLIYSMFSMAVMDFYHLGPKMNGFLLAYIGVLGIFVQGVLIGFITKRFTDFFNLKGALFLSMVGFMFLMVANNIVLLIIVIFPLGTGGSISHILLMAIITKVVAIKDTGSALGLVFALHAIVRALAPTTGGQLFTHVGWPFFGVIGYVMHLILIAYVAIVTEKEHFE